MGSLEIRPTVAHELAPILALYRNAFPEEDLTTLVRDLLREEPSLVLSLVAGPRDAPHGHIAFTMCRVVGCDRPVALLAPLAVKPACQGQGIGSALVREGLARLRHAGVSHVYVLGDPSYYGRHGFAMETGVTPPYPLPDQWLSAWQSLGLVSGGSPLRGALSVPEVWRRPALWAS